MSFDSDVLVVGAGPIGLISALSLAMNGVKVRIVEKLPVLAVGQRGAGIMPRTMETYHMLGISNEVKAVAGPLMPMQYYDPEGRPTKVFDMVERLQEAPGISESDFWLLGQDTVCKIASRHLKERFGIEVEFGSEVVNLNQDESGITATVNVQGVENKIHAKYVIGADGGRGVTRRLAGLKMVSQSNVEARVLIGDVVIKGFNTKYWHTYMDGKGNVLSVRPVPEKPELFFIFAFGPDLDIARAVTDVDHLLGWIHKITHRTDITIEKVSTLADWRLNVCRCEQFQSGRIILAGDAAHLHSPTGGQGLTSGVVDARNLSWKVALAVKSLASPGLLDSYSLERIPVISEMLEITTKLAAGTFKIKPDEEAFKRPTNLAQLGVHYRWSPIVYDGLREGEAQFESTNLAPQSVYGGGEETRLKAGDRAPQAPGLVGSQGETTLFDLFNVGRHTVLVFDISRAAAIRADVTKYPGGLIDVVTLLPAGSEKQEGAFVDAQGHAHHGYSTEAGVAVAIIRPDGVVGAILKAEESIEVYFSRIFSV